MRSLNDRNVGRGRTLSENCTITYPVSMLYNAPMYPNEASALTYVTLDGLSLVPTSLPPPLLLLAPRQSTPPQMEGPGGRGSPAQQEGPAGAAPAPAEADRDASSAEAGVVVADLKRALEAAIGERDRAVREKRQAVEEKNQLVEEKNQLVEEKNQLVEEKERALQVISDKDSLQNGTYYTPIDQVWKKEVDTYDDVNLFEALRRDRAPHFVARFIAKGAAPPPNPPGPKEGAWYVYSWTRAKAESAEYEMVSQRTTRSGLDAEKRLSIWPKDIFGSADTSKAEVAHLVPASHSASTLFFDVAILRARVGRCRLRLANDPEGDSRVPRARTLQN
jgi:hypothetical protein